MKEAILLLNMGGPDSLESVRPFLYNLFSDREIIQLGPAILQRPLAWLIARRRAGKSARCYSAIGGRSPLAEITAGQARGLQALLARDHGLELEVTVGMRYWSPRTPDVLGSLRDRGVSRVLALSLYPHYSRATSGSSISDFRKGARGMETFVVDSFPDDPAYIKALALQLQKGLHSMGIDGFQQAATESRGDFVLVYSAHSLPKSFIDQGDPYLDHLNRTIRALEVLTGVPGSLCFQSRSGPVEWLTPATDHHLKDLVKEGKRRLLVMPISFVSDHVETLYEVDILYSEMVRQMGASLYRVPSLNTGAQFIEALGRLALGGLKEAGWLE